jgi:hypothetical protein
MGAEPYWYRVKYQPDIDTALQQLRRQEFLAGRYNPVTPFPFTLFPIGTRSPAPGARHASIDEAREAAAEDGTRSILDLDHVSDYPDFCAVAPLDEAVLRSLYGTTRPTREMLERKMDFLENVERGQGVYIILYKGDEPDEIFFAGYSFD